MIAGQRNDNANLPQQKALALKALVSLMVTCCLTQIRFSVARVDFGESIVQRLAFNSGRLHDIIP